MFGLFLFVLTPVFLLVYIHYTRWDLYDIFIQGYVCIYVYVFMGMHVCVSVEYVCMYVYMYVSMYACVCICVCAGCFGHPLPSSSHALCLALLILFPSSLPSVLIDSVFQVL